LILVTRLQSYYLLSLGCPKNLVDSAGLAALLDRAGLAASPSPDQADLLIVNTCGFITPAREESLAALREMAQAKQPHQRIVAAGCYAQRSPGELADAVPAIDGLVGTRRWADVGTLVDMLERLTPRAQPFLLPENLPPATPDVPRVAIQGASAYLKLADGCRRACAFCAIPLIKGPAVSRPPADILSDARLLAERGVQEMILIGQDTTDYGTDLGMRDGLADLLDRLVEEAVDVPWIRLMYAYPGRVTERLIETMSAHPQILPYLDIPLQHAHPDVLRRMHRPSDVDRVRRTIRHLRAAMPGIAIRTTFLVGFPGENEPEFRALEDFCSEIQFDRVGVFVYSHEAGTPAASLEDDVPQEEKESRRHRLMRLQEPISLARNLSFVGRTLDVLIEGQGEGVSVGRSYRDAPEVDGLVLVQEDLPVGEIVPIDVTAALKHDLIGESRRV
jgi:ribosomal protein S12 methylthiotransferase